MRGGVKTIYPEYRAVAEQAATIDALTVPVSKSANDVAKRIADQSPRDGQVHVMPVQGNVYMLIADGTNITASVGTDGIAVVNTGSAQMTDKVLAALNELARSAVERAGDQQLLRRQLPGRRGLVEPVLQHRRRLAASGAADPLHHQHERGTGACRRQREARRVGRSSAAPAAGGFGGAVARRRHDGDDRRARGRARRR